MDVWSKGAGLFSAGAAGSGVSGAADSEHTTVFVMFGDVKGKTHPQQASVKIAVNLGEHITIRSIISLITPKLDQESRAQTLNPTLYIKQVRLVGLLPGPSHRLPLRLTARRGVGTHAQKPHGPVAVESDAELGDAIRDSTALYMVLQPAEEGCASRRSRASPTHVSLSLSLSLSLSVCPLADTSARGCSGRSGRSQTQAAKKTKTVHAAMQPHNQARVTGRPRGEDPALEQAFDLQPGDEEVRARRPPQKNFTRAHSA